MLLKDLQWSFSHPCNLAITSMGFHKHNSYRAGLMARCVSEQSHVDTHRTIPASWLPLGHSTRLCDKRRGHLTGLLSMLCQFNNSLSILKKQTHIPSMLSAGKALTSELFLRNCMWVSLSPSSPRASKSSLALFYHATWIRHCSQSRKKF
jgi:hypothetical protein